ncbi:DNA methyltransferase [Lysinibacillus contaminans]|uniref:DNA (cytosine-5-)-methyltransferase n=1 Tax=Lysinibacillus contaminans TaxID=1293441 RepID=A0ABR5JYJ0_9BACI|nr:DNA cytosine methyltransferase [Lysinibacillus contaminans]KOS67706.1 DNA methyltransferase [Lysinibacillus contaminans]
MSNKSNKFKLIDLFAGAGGLSNGFEQTGRFEVIGAVEINKEATQTYIDNHGKNPDIIIKAEDSGISDITKIDFNRFLEEKNINGNETVVIGGPPCQGFSNANRQKNHLISGNNQLVKEYARAIDEIRPIAFLMENVKTMNSDKHKFFVTEHIENTIYAYSSENHLKEINGSKNKPFWVTEELTLIETNNCELEQLIKALTACEVQNPIIFKETHLSRMRSIIRNLKKKKLYVVEKTKEIEEIKEIIKEINSYESPLTDEDNSLKKIIDTTTKVLESLILQCNNDNKETLDKLYDFIDINQLLRYMNELKKEKIICLGKPEISLVNFGKIRVSIEVMSYNIVEYLTVFFKYIQYDIDPQVMMASDFYTPQKRARFMILGVKKSAIKNGDVKMPATIESNKLPFTVYDAIKDLETIKPAKDVVENNLPYQLPENITKMQKYFRSNMKEDVIYNHINTASEPLSRQRFEALKENDGKNFHSLSKELKEISYTDGSRTQNTVYLRLKYDEPSPTVINVRKSMWQHPENPVALSIREAARLQSFKDDFIFKGTKDKQYQQIGNAVPPLLARAVAEQMLYIMGEKPDKKLSEEFEI